MSFWKRFFDKKQKIKEPDLPNQTQEIKNKNESLSPAYAPGVIPLSQPLKQETGEHVLEEGKSSVQPNPANRSIRVFVSSTFKDMIEDRNELMTHTWPELRRFSREQQMELVEVDMRWGIAEEQSRRKETLKLCLDEIHACRPFFIGLLGERYGWVPGEDAFTPDLLEEQPWLKECHGKSATELEILHGVLNNPEMAERAFFYFRDPIYAQEKGIDFLPESDQTAEKQTALKNHIRTTCAEKNIPLHDMYPNPEALAALVLEQLKAAIEAQFPKADIPDPLDQETRNHEAFAETRRHTYIGRLDYYEALDRYVTGEGAPLVLLGDSGSGKSAMLANWVDRNRKAHPKDIIFQHYIGGTPDSAVHWKLMARLMAEVKHWTDDPEELPRSNDDIHRDFPLWVSKARIKAERDGVRFIVVLDALNQLDEKDHGRLLGWLPEHSFKGALKLIVSTLPGDTMEVMEKRAWPTLQIQPLTTAERKRMIVDYLDRFGKKLDTHRLNRLAVFDAAANPLYLKILLDELRITGTHNNLDDRLDDYLAAKEIPTLLGKVIARYQRDYEDDRKGLVNDTLELIWASRRGLTETELLHLLKPPNLPQLPLASWAPLRAALEESLVDQGGILNFSHDFLRKAVEAVFLQDPAKKDDCRIVLAGYFEAQPSTERSCDELPWLLWQAEMFERLRNCLLDIDRFLSIHGRDEDELRTYWVNMNEERSMGESYINSFNAWSEKKGMSHQLTAFAANQLGMFLFNASLHAEAEQLIKKALKIVEKSSGKDYPNLATDLNNLAELYRATNRLDKAEPLIKRALKIDEENFGKDHPNVAIRLSSLAELYRATNYLNKAELLYLRALKIDEQSFGNNHPTVARDLNNLAQLLQATNRLTEAEPLMKRALKIDEESYGNNHPTVARDLNNLARLFQDTNRLDDAEPLMKRALKIDEQSLGKDHPKVANRLNNLATLLKDTNRLDEAEPLMKRALSIYEKSFGKDHPKAAIGLNNLANLYHNSHRLDEAESLYLRALKIDEQSFGKDHPNVARDLNNLATLFLYTNRLNEAEPLLRRVLKIAEQSFGKDHPRVATILNNLGSLLKSINRLAEAEQLMKRSVEILIIFTRTTGQQHPYFKISVKNYTKLLQTIGRSKVQIDCQLKKMGLELF